MRDAVGTAYAIGALVLSALGSVLTKVASKRFSKEIISFYIGISVLILGNLMVAFFDGSAPKFPTDFRPWIIGTFVALLGVVQQLFLIGMYDYLICTKYLCIKIPNSSFPTHGYRS